MSYRNYEGYNDPTCGAAIARAARSETRRRRIAKAYLSQAGKSDIAGLLCRIPNPQCRLVLKLRYMEHLSWEQISERTGCSLYLVRCMHKTGLDACDCLLAKDKRYMR